MASLTREGEFAISTTAGKKPISVRTLAGWARTLVGDSIEGFQLKRIRSGVETLLAGQGVSREVRGHLQSHGLTGIQARHYDGHDYLQQKRRALELLVREVCKSQGHEARIHAQGARRRAFSVVRRHVRRSVEVGIAGGKGVPGEELIAK